MLRIEIYQQKACFRIPQMGNPILSYPLAPPSTVLGLFRYITNYVSINKENTKIAISGTYESKIRHIVTNHITGISDKGQYKSNIIPTEELYNITHIVHIKSEHETEIKNCIRKAHRFGRSEDIILKIQCQETQEQNSNIDWLNVDFKNIKNFYYYIYLPFEKFSKLESLAIFNVPIDSDKGLLDQGFLKMYYQKVLFTSVKRIITNKDIFLDSEGYLYVWIN